MIISHKYKFIFIKSVKTAGTSIEIFLSQFCDDRDICTPLMPKVDPGVARDYKQIGRNYRGLWNPISDIIETRGEILRGRGNLRRVIKHILFAHRFYNHMPAKLIKTRLPEDIWNSYYKFCVERNPWDKTLSHYYMFSSQNGGKTFDEYIANRIFPVNHKKYTDFQGNLMVDKVIKYESLDSGLAEVFEKIGIPFEGSLGVTAMSHHRKDRRPYQEVLTPEQRDFISNLLAKEIEINGYVY